MTLKDIIFGSPEEKEEDFFRRNVGKKILAKTTMPTKEEEAKEKSEQYDN